MKKRTQNFHYIFSNYHNIREKRMIHTPNDFLTYRLGDINDIISYSGFSLKGNGFKKCLIFSDILN